VTSGGGTITSGASSAALAMSSGPTNTIMDLTGTVTVTTGESFNIFHDDGVDLIINGVDVVDAPNVTSPENSSGTYTGPSGTFSFSLYYDECCGAPAVLQTTLPLTATPEPASLGLMGLSLLGAGIAYRRRRKAA